MLYDKAKIYVEGGRGGDGCISFRREAHVPRGGPDGGDGGRGGDVVLVCDPSRRDLASLHRARHFPAGRGGHGRGKQQHGARGKDKVILVAPRAQFPPGSTARGTLDAEERQLVLADIPGLIEGAAKGAGLGHEFLAHVERCRVLVLLVDIAGEDPASAHEAVRQELREYGAALELLPELVVLSKRDLVPDDEAEGAISEWSDRLGEGVVGVLAASSANGAGIEQLRRAVLEAVPEVEGAAVAAPAV